MACRLLLFLLKSPPMGLRPSGGSKMVSVVEKIGDYWARTEISREILQDKLSEFLAAERGGVALYSAALRLVFDREVSRRFKLFSEQTRQHERILLAVIDAVGMDHSYVSAEAATARQKADALLKTMTAARPLTAKAAELNAIENIVLAETKDHTDWEFLGKIARQCEDPKLREVLRLAVSEVEPQESEHLNWTTKQLARLAFTDVCEKIPRPRVSKHKASSKAGPPGTRQVANDKRPKKAGAARKSTAKSAKAHGHKRRKAARKKTSHR
jgi:rubrerythrin